MMSHPPLVRLRRRPGANQVRTSCEPGVNQFEFLAPCGARAWWRLWPKGACARVLCVCGASRRPGGAWRRCSLESLYKGRWVGIGVQCQQEPRLLSAAARMSGRSAIVWIPVPRINHPPLVQISRNQVRTKCEPDANRVRSCSEPVRSKRLPVLPEPGAHFCQALPLGPGA